MQIFELPGSLILEITGRDSARYLNARLTNDIKSLTAPGTCRAAALNPQGRTEGFFRVIAAAKDHYILTCDGGDPEKVIPAFKRYIVADRVDVKDLSGEFSAVHLIPGPQTLTIPVPGKEAINLPAGPADVLIQEGLYAVRAVRAGPPGYDLICSSALSSQICSSLVQDGAILCDGESLKLKRIKAGIPSFPEELNDSHLFSESGLSDAVSFRKGCYVGQEVVEKIDAYASLPKVLKKLKLEGKLENSADLHVFSAVQGENTPNKIGKILSFVYDPGENATYCFAAIKSDFASNAQTFTVGGLTGRTDDN